MTSLALKDLTDLGVSIWLDDLNRSRITSGNLSQLVSSHYVRGVTTNPAIFDKAIRSGAVDYRDAIAVHAATLSPEAIVRQLTTDDVRNACDILMPVWAASSHVDGRVSIEVDPRLARDTLGTIEQAQALWQEVDRPNVLIKIPATLEGLPAITETISRGISVNVTLIFSVERYQEVMQAYADGLEKALKSGRDISDIHSVASFFVSRVDTAIDRRLDDMGVAPAQELRGRAAIANVRLAWQAYQNFVSTREWEFLSAHGALVQRPLWASTGVKDPAYSDTRYVLDIAASGCVNTMPEATLFAVNDHGQFRGDTLTGLAQEAETVMEALAEVGISIAEVCEELEIEGVDAFIKAWQELLDNVAAAVLELRA